MSAFTWFSPKKQLLLSLIILLLIIFSLTIVFSIEAGEYRHYTFGRDFNLSNWVTDANGVLDTDFSSVCTLMGKNATTNAQVFNSTPMLHDAVINGLYYVEVNAANTTNWPKGKYDVIMSCTDGTLSGTENVSFVIDLDATQMISDTNSYLSQLIIDTNAIGKGLNADQNQLLFDLNNSVNLIPANVWSYATRTLTDYNQSLMWDKLNQIQGIASDINGNTWISVSDVWNYSDRTLTDTNFAVILNYLQDINSTTKDINGNTWVSADDIWNASARTLTDYNQLDMWNYLNDNNAVLYDVKSKVYVLDRDVWNYSDRNLTDYNKQDLLNYLQDINNGVITTNNHTWLSAADVWAYSTKTITDLNTENLWNYLSNIDSITTDINSNVWVSASDVWNYYNRQLTDYNQTQVLNYLSGIDATTRDTNGKAFVLAQDVWNYSIRNLTDYNQATMLAYLQDINTFSVNTNENTSNIWLNQKNGFKTVLSNFGKIANGGKFLAKLWVYDFNGAPKDADALPKVTLYDPVRNIVVENVDMNREERGIYTYSYTTSASSTSGQWEAIAIATINGETVKPSDYWELTGNPPEVKVNSITDDSVPTISANVLITNEGVGNQEYQYEYCIVTSQDNQCGGSDDVDYASGAKLISAGQSWNPTLTLNATNVGTYWFKIKVYYGSETSAASKQFTAVSQTTQQGNTGGGGGSSGGPLNPTGNEQGLVWSIDSPTEIRIQQGTFSYAKIVLKNTGSQKIENISTSLEGLLFNWYYISQEKKSLLPGEEQTILVKIAIPKDAEAKDYLVVLKLSANNLTAEKQLVVRITQSEQAEILFEDIVTGEIVSSGEGKITIKLFNNTINDLNLIASLLTPKNWSEQSEEFDLVLKAGEHREITFDVTAPEKTGAYEFVFTLQNKNGQIFATSKTSKLSKEFLVMVENKEVANSGLTFNFTNSIPTTWVILAALIIVIVLFRKKLVLAAQNAKTILLNTFVQIKTIVENAFKQKIVKESEFTIHDIKITDKTFEVFVTEEGHKEVETFVFDINEFSNQKKWNKKISTVISAKKKAREILAEHTIIAKKNAETKPILPKANSETEIILPKTSNSKTIVLPKLNTNQNTVSQKKETLKWQAPKVLPKMKKKSKPKKKRKTKISSEDEVLNEVERDLVN